MTEAGPVLISPGGVGRAALARENSVLARELLADCRLCAHDCGVNRLAGERGLCRAGAETRFFSAQSEVSDEIELTPVFALALSGCDLRCDFCITGASSWNPKAGEAFDAVEMAGRACRALAAGVKTVMVLGGEPTIHLPAALEFAAMMPDTATLIWKTNAHGSAQARKLLDGVFNLWVADFKFGNDACAQRLAGIRDYVRTVEENLIWAHGHTRLIIRHLLMPGHFECCWRPVAEWLAPHLPGARVNLRAGFWPAWQARRHAEFRQGISSHERDQAFALAEELGLRLIQ